MSFDPSSALVEQPLPSEFSALQKELASCKADLAERDLELNNFRIRIDNCSQHLTRLERLYEVAEIVTGATPGNATSDAFQEIAELVAERTRCARLALMSKRERAEWEGE